MRTKQERKTIVVSRQIHDRIMKDRKDFQEKIGGGKWSVDDTITEYLKIISDRMI